MGVTGLWTVLQPVGRPVKLETLNRRRLAVDASIWIYQFLKAVRDKEGNALRNSHVVGFFRRICKLLFFGIRPVFVFDGGAPALKRQTVRARRARREGRREDAARTAGKLLARQLHRAAEEEAERRRKEARRARPAQPAQQEEEPLPDKLVYVAEQLMTPQQKQAKQQQQQQQPGGPQFKKKDAYHLPALDVSLAEMGAPNDPRIMSQEELEDYARQFHDGEDVNLYDFSKIDFDSTFFVSLPATDRYNILNAARLRSRLRMGYSKEQLDTMFPDRMAFSRFQIERVKERNDLTQRLMNINGMNPNDVGSGRIAGEKGKEYVLVKNEGVEGGWALGVVSNNKDEGKREQPIDLDKPVSVPKAPLEDDSDDSFEDVPVEGLNRLPKRPKRRESPEEARQSLPALAYHDYANGNLHQDDGALAENTLQHEDDDYGDGLFVRDDNAASEAEDLFEDVQAPPGDEVEDAELQRAIAMSLDKDSEDEDMSAYLKAGEEARAERLRKDNVLGFSKRNAAAGRAFASYVNARAAKAAPRQIDSYDDLNPELRAAFEAGRKMGPREKREEESAPAPAAKESGPGDVLAQPGEFKGPLPFESIDLGKSLFTKKKQPEKEEKQQAEEGGFEKEQPEKAKPLPPWFSGDLNKDEFEQSHIQTQADSTDGIGHRRPHSPVLKQQRTNEVIDLDAEEESRAKPIEIMSSDDEEDETNLVEHLENGSKTPPEDPHRVEEHGDVAIVDDVAESDQVEPAMSRTPKMDDVAESVRAEPPVSTAPKEVINAEHVDLPQAEFNTAPTIHSPGEDSYEWEESDFEEREKKRDEKSSNGMPLSEDQDGEEKSSPSSPEPDFEDVEAQPGGTMEVDQDAEPKSPEFDGVKLSDAIEEIGGSPGQQEDKAADQPNEEAFDQPTGEDGPQDFDFSDPEDEDLMRQLAIEAEEHARFAAELNTGTGLQSAADFERELKQLRTQQKNERRDADEVTQVMITECQQLLRLFGLPYITAPMEAEAQCAELLNLGLVDGIVTDDSDIFLFGGSRVYKNMFNQAKFVECYTAGDLEREYGLGREKIIQIAHLLGSDYTDGVPGIGPVTALEILTEFGDLQAFQKWWTDVQTGIAPPEPKGFKKKFRKNATKIFLPPGFPDLRVDQAYLEPEVDNDRSQFQWGVPDLDALRQFLMATIGWSQERTDEILVPVIRDMNKRDVEGTQANITHFYRPGGAAVAGQEGYAPRRRQETKSTRMENALGRLHEQTRRTARGGASEEGGQQQQEQAQAATGDNEPTEPAVGKGASKKRKSRKKAAQKPDRSSADEADDSNDDDDDGHEPTRKAPRKRGRGRREKS